jgi:hypothetical protein
MVRFAVFTLLTSVTFADGSGIPQLDLNTPHRLLADKVRVRTSADTHAKVLAELPIGTEITPVTQSNARTKIDGVDAPWYEVDFLLKGSKMRGFIWGNLIAKGFAISSDGTLFLYGVGHGRSSGDSESYGSQIRVARNNREIARLFIDEGIGFASRVKVDVTTGRGFSKVKNIFSVRFQQEYCGGKGNLIHFFWTGAKLIAAHSSSEGSDAPVYAIEKQIFPDEKGGKKDALFIERENGDHDNPSAKQIEKFWLVWNGRSLVREKALP